MNMQRVGVFTALIAFFLLATGCGGGNGGTSGHNNITPVVASLSIAPEKATIAPGKSISLAVAAANTGILWPQTVAGAYQRNGNTVIYTPPAVEGTYEFTVTASADSTKKATAKITVNPPQITVFPKTATIRQGMSFRFVADVQPEQAVTWKVSGQCGTATPDGRFQALNAGICSITASAIGTNGSEMSAEAEITVLAGAVNTGLVSVAAVAQSINLPANNFALCYSDEAEEAVNAGMNIGDLIFGIIHHGTPTTVLLNRETGAYKTVNGASPADTFESAFAEVLKGSQLPVLSPDTVSEILADARYYGNPDASIVFIVYCDLLCPFCREQYRDETVETVMANHPGEATMAFMNYPLWGHPTAFLGAKGLYCAGKIGGDDAYYSYLAQAIQAGGFAD